MLPFIAEVPFLLRWVIQHVVDFQVASAIREVVAVADGPNNAHVVCGDFNAWPDTAVYQLSKEGYLNDASMAALQASTDVEMNDGSVSNCLPVSKT